MVAGAGIMVLLGVVVLLLALAAAWWLVAERRAAGSEVDPAGAALAVPADGPTHLSSSLPEEPVGDDVPAPGLAQAADQRLRELDELLAQGLIDPEEYAATRAAILGTL